MLFDEAISWATFIEYVDATRVTLINFLSQVFLFSHFYIPHFELVNGDGLWLPKGDHDCDTEVWFLSYH